MSMSHAQMLRLKRWNTPTVYNGWEAYTAHSRTGGCFNLEETRDFMPAMGPMVGRAVTVVIEPSNPAHVEANADAWRAYREYVAQAPGPKIVVVQDLDRPRVIGSFWGEVNANAHRALGCVGTITDGAIRDLDEMTNAGFKAIARRLCVGHAYVHPVRWGVPVEVFGCAVTPGQLIHADKHGFLAIPAGDEDRLYDAATFMDGNECDTVIAAARMPGARDDARIVDDLTAAGQRFGQGTQAHFGKDGEWS